MKTRWTLTAQTQLKHIYDFLRYVKLTRQGAENVKSDLIQASKSVTFPDQCQQDEINPKYRRIIVRHYKMLYKVEDETVIIMRIFDVRQNPTKQME